MEINLEKLTTSWTKYDIVRVMEVLYDKETLISYLNQTSIINIPILKAFLGVKELNIDSLPTYWLEIFKYPKEKKIFALFSVILTHHEVIKLFRDKYSKDNFKGIFLIDEGKMYTNIRSCLVESEAASPKHRRTKVVPYEFDVIFQNIQVGKLFKQLLIERLDKIVDIEINETNYLEIVKYLNLSKVFSCEEDFFIDWLESATKIEKQKFSNYPYIKEFSIESFYSVYDKMYIHLDNSKEIYFLGENGDGKSLILMGIYLAFNQHYILKNTEQEKTGRVADMINNNPKLLLHAKDSLDNKFGTKVKASETKHLPNFFAYGTHRGRYSSDDHEEYGFMSLFSTEEKLMSPEKWLKDQKLLDLSKSEDFRFSSFEVIEKTLSEILENNVKPELQGTDLIFKDQLSEGYRSVTIFVVDLLYRLTKITKSGEDIFRTPAIVIVDEIDSHLHPKWKLTLVQKLRKLFPNIQFIFTTHSPTIIQGASDDAIIYKVFRNSETGNTSITDDYFRKDMNHMMLNTLVTSSLFGLENARLSNNNEEPDTNDDDLTSRIHKIAKQRIQEKKAKRSTPLSEEEIDELIKSVFENYD
ncbi:AAA family ATPase [Empedobacter sp.]|uniref:AAA family ATPase n=1 Tax=Empedobacter sp. TaxID=1927715 RepID=UPI0028AACA4A|nr:AAA family ATPase [Empedobacter sp.]